MKGGFCLKPLFASSSSSRSQCLDFPLLFFSSPDDPFHHFILLLLPPVCLSCSRHAIDQTHHPATSSRNQNQSLFFIPFDFLSAPDIRFSTFYSTADDNRRAESLIT